MNRLFKTFELGATVSVYDQDDKAVDFDLDYDGTDLEIRVTMPRNNEIVSEIIDRHPELRKELELLKNDFELKGDC